MKYSAFTNRHSFLKRLECFFESIMKKPSDCSAFLFGRVPVGLVAGLFATTNAVATTAVHDEKPRKNIADIATTATHQEKDEDVVIATTATVCSTICKEAVHYVNPLDFLDCSYSTIRFQKFLCSYSFQNFQNSTWIFLFCRH